MIENPYEPSTPTPVRTHDGRSRLLVWAGVFSLVLAGLCIIVTAGGMILAFSSIASTPNPSPSELASNISWASLPSFAIAPCGILGAILIAIGLLVRRPELDSSIDDCL